MTRTVGQSGSSTGGADQAERLRELARRRRAGALTVAITSGKGGVGKTNIAVNLSICLAGEGLRVTLVDVDMGLANADLLLNVSPRYTLSHLLDGVRGLEEVVTEGPKGIRFVPGASGFHGLANLTDFERQHLIHQLRKLEINTDIMVLDCGAGISRNVLGFAYAADRVVVVTTPQPTALTDAYATIKALVLEKARGRISVIVNMARSRAEANATFRRLAEVSKRFLDYSIADGGYLLQDVAVELAVRERCPFVLGYPDSNASACVAAAARLFASARLQSDSGGSFFRRVVGLFI